MKQNQNQDHCIGGKKKIILSDNIDNIDNISYNFFFLEKILMGIYVFTLQPPQLITGACFRAR